MLTAFEFYDLLHEKPFRPFRVYLKDGRTFDTRYPHLTKAGVDYLLIGTPAEGVPIPFAETSDKIPLSMIDRVEMLTPEPASSSS
jgi:hypothetical protein